MKCFYFNAHQAKQVKLNVNRAQLVLSRTEQQAHNVMHAKLAHTQTKLLNQIANYVRPVLISQKIVSLLV
jgi:hypothetical protein